MSEHRKLATAIGMTAIPLWGCTFWLTRSLSEWLRPMTTGAAVFGLAGTLGCLILLARREKRRQLRGLTARYLLGCGGLFVAYTVCIYAAIGLAAGRQQVLEVSVINYLWPGLTVVFSIPILHSRPRAILPLGLLLAGAGVVLAGCSRGANWEAFQAGLRENALPYALALACATTWAMYSLLARRWVSPGGGGAVPIFLLVSAAATAALAVWFGEKPQWRNDLVWPLLGAGLGPGLAGYLAWEYGMRHGNVTALACAAFATPVFAAVITSIMLAVSPGPALWAGFGFVTVGAIVCKLGVRDRQDANNQIPSTKSQTFSKRPNGQ